MKPSCPVAMRLILMRNLKSGTEILSLVSSTYTLTASQLMMQVTCCRWQHGASELHDVIAAVEKMAGALEARTKVGQHYAILLFLSCEGVKAIDFNVAGTLYSDFLLVFLAKSQKTWTTKCGLLLQHENAQPHIARATLQTCTSSVFHIFHILQILSQVITTFWTTQGVDG